MMSDAPHDKAKKKGKPSFIPRWLIRLFLVVVCFVALLWIAAVGFVVLMFTVFHTHDFPQKEIAEACTSLALPPDSTFCTEPVQNSETLKALLEEMYPPSSTTVTDLKTHFKDNFTCNRPARCYLDVPINFVNVWIVREEGSDRITEYDVYYDD
jgi:hypothetical protein